MRAESLAVTWLQAIQSPGPGGAGGHSSLSRAVTRANLPAPVLWDSHANRKRQLASDLGPKWAYGKRVQSNLKCDKSGYRTQKLMKSD